MKPRARADPAADPRNAVKKLYAVRRRHRTRWPPVEMVSMDAVQTVLKGMMKEFIDARGFRSLVPKRKLPLTNDTINGMLGVPEGAARRASPRRSDPPQRLSSGVQLASSDVSSANGSSIM